MLDGYGPRGAEMARQGSDVLRRTLGTQPQVLAGLCGCPAASKAEMHRHICHLSKQVAFFVKPTFWEETKGKGKEGKGRAGEGLKRNSMEREGKGRRGKEQYVVSSLPFENITFAQNTAASTIVTHAVRFLHASHTSRSCPQRLFQITYPRKPALYAVG